MYRFFLTNFMTNIPIESGNIDLLIFRAMLKLALKGPALN